MQQISACAKYKSRYFSEKKKGLEITKTRLKVCFMFTHGLKLLSIVRATRKEI